MLDRIELQSRIDEAAAAEIAFKAVHGHRPITDAEREEVQDLIKHPEQIMAKNIEKLDEGESSS